MSNNETIQALAPYLDFELDQNSRQRSVDVAHSSEPVRTVSEAGDRRYAWFRREDETPENFDNSAEGIIEDPSKPNIPHGEESEPDSLNAQVDRSLHGLLEDKDGFIALKAKEGDQMSLYEFAVISAANGANNAHRTLGRLPGIDIPEFICDTSNDSGVFSAGQITEAIADMKMLVPDIDNFFLVRHDLGTGPADHGTSWSHAAPELYYHLSRVAQDVIERYGERIHYSNAEEKAARPSEIIDIAKTLDKIRAIVKPETIARTELKIRDERYNDVADKEIENELAREVFLKCGRGELNLAELIQLTRRDANELEVAKLSQSFSIQLYLGALSTRLALHRRHPHPEASEEQTTRTIAILEATIRGIERFVLAPKDFQLK